MNKLYLLLALGASVNTQSYAGDCLDVLDDTLGWADLDCGDECWDNFYEYVYGGGYYDYDLYCFYYDGYYADYYSAWLCSVFVPYCDESYYESDIDVCMVDMYTCAGDLDCYVTSLCYYIEFEEYDACVDEFYEELEELYAEYYGDDDFRKKMKIKKSMKKNKKGPAKIKK